MEDNNKRRYFFGVSRIEKLITELVNIYSDKPSYFSKKRIESGVAFVIAQYGMIDWFCAHYNIMTSSDLAIWAGIEFAIAGYIINQIQKGKDTDN